MSPAVAYRKDVEKRKGPIGKDDGSWIAISTIVSEVAHARGGQRRQFLDDAAKMASELFDPEALAYGCEFDPSCVDRTSSFARLRLLAETMERAGTLNLAASLLEGLARVLPATSVNSGRVLAQRARVSWKGGNTDLAKARYQHLQRRARGLESNELLVRSMAGFAALAQLRGNYPDLRLQSRKIVTLAERCGYVRLAGMGHQGLMLGEAAASHYSEAIPHGWSAYQCREGDPRGQTECLSNIAQLFYLAGHSTVARDAFVRVLASHPAPNIGAAALGGYALASAVLSDERAVRWAAAEATNLSDILGPKYESVTSLIECSSALEAINDYPYASVLRARAATMAQYAGFFELVHKSEVSARRAPAVPAGGFRDAEIEVANNIRKLPPVALPESLELAGV